jgi:hypothetical protein
VTFEEGTTILGTATLSNGVAILPTTPSSAGAETLTITYGGDANDQPSSVILPLNVAQAPATLPQTSTTPLVTIAGVTIQKTITGKSKTRKKVIDVEFSGQVNAAEADNPGVYTLTTVPQGKKHKTKPVALIRAIYNLATKTVMLIPKKSPLSLNPPLILTINGANLHDTLGRPVDGKGDGQPGGIFTVELG